MLRIYGYAASINVRKVLWICKELDLPFCREDWAGPFRSTPNPAFRALNPVGLVPVIDDDGVIVWESNTILRYLARSRGRNDLVPTDPRQLAEVEMWMDWQASDFNNSWRIAFQGLVRRNPDYQDAAAIARSLEDFSRMVAIVDAQLAKPRDYICGIRFSAADIAIGLSIHRWLSMPADKPTLPHVADYYQRLCERPGFRQFGRGGGP